MTELSLEAKLVADTAGLRLDQALADIFSDYSRSRIQAWIRNGNVKIDGQIITKPRTKVMGEEQVIIHAELEAEVDWKGEDIAIDIVYEDDDIIVVNKSAGLVVHPGAGNWQGTLVNALLFHHPQLEELPRAGIVHRLDKDTSGLMVVAKTLEAHTHLVNQLQSRTVSRHYLCLAYGAITAGGTISRPIGRHPIKRTQMAVVESGKHATTHYRVEQRFNNFTFLRVKLETGRTHQIRVHLTWLKHSLVGDPVYGAGLRLPPGAGDDLKQVLSNFRRQALHATELGLIHPATLEEVNWQAPLPADMQDLLTMMNEDPAS